MNVTLPDKAPAAEQPILPDRYQQLRRQLRYAVCRTCPGWLAQDADDLVQEALIRLLKRNGRGLNLHEVNTSYLRKVAYSAVVDEMRRRQRQVILVPEQQHTGIDDYPDCTPARDGDIGSAIGDCLSQQTPARRQAVTLHLLGHTVPQVAQLMDATPKRAENLVYRGLAKLRACLTAKGLKP